MIDTYVERWLCYVDKEKKLCDSSHFKKEFSQYVWVSMCMKKVIQGHVSNCCKR